MVEEEPRRQGHRMKEWKHLGDKRGFQDKEEEQSFLKILVKVTN